MSDDETIKHSSPDGNTSARALTPDEARAMGIAPSAPPAAPAPSEGTAELVAEPTQEDEADALAWERLLDTADTFADVDPQMQQLLTQAEAFERPPLRPAPGSGKSAERGRWEVVEASIRQRITMHTGPQRATAAAGPNVANLVRDPNLTRVTVNEVAQPQVAGAGVTVQHLGVMPRQQLNAGIQVQHVGGSPQARRRVELEEAEREARRFAGRADLSEDVRVAADALAEALAGQLEADAAADADTGPVSLPAGG